MKAHLYLDVDGVVNAYDLRYASGEPEWKSGYTSFRADNGFRITYAPDMIARLNEIIDTYGVVGHWLTTWEYEARQLGERIGLKGSEEWEVLPALQYGRKGGWLKFHSIRAHVEETKPDVAFWFDDDLYHEPEAWKWGVENLRPYAPVGEVGITQWMLDDMENNVGFAILEEA